MQNSLPTLVMAFPALHSYTPTVQHHSFGRVHSSASVGEISGWGGRGLCVSGLGWGRGEDHTACPPSYPSSLLSAPQQPWPSPARSCHSFSLVLLGWGWARVGNTNRWKGQRTDKEEEAQRQGSGPSPLSFPQKWGNELKMTPTIIRFYPGKIITHYNVSTYRTQLFGGCLKFEAILRSGKYSRWDRFLPVFIWLKWQCNLRYSLISLLQNTGYWKEQHTWRKPHKQLYRINYCKLVWGVNWERC